MNFAYKTQILFILTFGTLVYFGFQEHEDSTVNYKRGLLVAIFLFIVQGSMSQYSGPLIKGFEFLRRAASKITLVYLLLLVFMFYQTADDIHQFFSSLYSELGKPIRMGCMFSYDDSCEWTWKDVYDNLDHLYIQDLAAWFFTTLIVRDVYALYFSSFLIQVFDLFFEHFYSLLRACSWQRIVLDIICTHTLGMILGMFVIKKLGLRKFDWFGRQGKEDIKNLDVFHNHRRFGGVCVMFLVLTANVFCGIFMFHALWIPPRHTINIYRIIIWLLLEALSIAELHDDVETWGTETRRKTPISNEYRWIVSGILVLETAISWKLRHGAGYYRYLNFNLLNSGPWNVICVILILAAAVFYLYLRFKRNRTTEYGDSPWEVEARNLDILEASESNPEKKRVEGKGKVTTFQQVRNEGHEEKTRHVKENKKGKIKRD